MSRIPRWCARVAAAATIAGPAGGAGPSVEVLDVAPVHRLPALAGPKPTELSGLAWDERRGELVAVSDRGPVFRITLDLEHRRLHSATVRGVIGVTGGARPNAESVAIDGDTLWIADEARHDLLQVGRQGQTLQRRPLPARLADSTAPQRGNSGVEALVLHPTYGKLVIPQRPPRQTQEGLHRIYAEDGRVFAFRADPREQSSVKAADLLGAGRLLVLEKLSPQGVPRFQLRLVELASCDEAGPCDPEAWPVRLPDSAAGLNLEGMACLSHDLCVLANDNAGDRDAGSHLVLLALPPG